MTLKIKFAIKATMISGSKVFQTLGAPSTWQKTPGSGNFSSRIAFLDQEGNFFIDLQENKMIKKVLFFFTDSLKDYIVFEEQDESAQIKIESYVKKNESISSLLTLVFKKPKISHFYSKNQNENPITGSLSNPIFQGFQKFFPLYKFDFSSGANQEINFQGDLNCFLKFSRSGDQGSMDDVLKFLKTVRDNFKILLIDTK
jgi:hypothetical protein